MNKNEINTLNFIDEMLQEASSLSKSGKVDDAVTLVEEAHNYYKNRIGKDNKSENIDDQIVFYQADVYTYPDPVRIIFKSIMMLDLLT